MPRLYVLSGPDVGKSFEVEAGAVIGRAAECAAHLRDPSVSRHHARLDFEDGRWTIVDTQSRNGVTVRGHRVPSAPLEDGDEFQLGEVLLRFRTAIVAEAAAAPTPPITPAPATAPPPPRGAQEITLEGDWDPAAATRGPSASPFAAPRPASPLAEAPSLARTTLAMPFPGAPVQRGQRVLQFHKISDRPGFFAAEIGQQPLWVRIGVGIVAIAIFAGLFLLAFKSASFLKAKTQRAELEVEEAR